MVWMILAGIVVVVAGFPGALLTQRKLRQKRTAATLKIEGSHGIVEERFVRIGGIEQWVGIRGEDQDNPVLLLMHGGPGCSYSIFTPHLRFWEQYFTVVQWDQRGGGKTYGRMGSRRGGEISLEQLTRDAIEVVEYVRALLGKDRIFLLASSLGSIFGTEVVRRRPELFYAYIGTDQNVGMRKGGAEEFREVVGRLRALGLMKGEKALERIGPDATGWSADDFSTVARWTMKSDPRGFHRTMNLLKNAVWNAPGWTLKDIRAFVAGMRYSLEKLLPEITRYDAWEQGTCFEVPFFIFQGEDDVLTTPKRAEAFFNDVVAPMKRMALIRDAGHFAAFMEPNQFLRELLADVRPLAESASVRAIERT
jgi:pimeloyl-ACP methyl ester carboxylesterase